VDVFIADLTPAVELVSFKLTGVYIPVTISQLAMTTVHVILKLPGIHLS
jgi:hypothetical protein